MKIIHYSNSIVYLVVVVLYCINPIYGMLGQFVLGIFQLVLAIRLSLEFEHFNETNKKSIRIYWYTLLIWLFLLIILLINNKVAKDITIAVICIIPMFIGLFFIRVTFLVYKHSKQ